MDGWLINIENKVNADDVLKLRDFVAMLTDAMHSKIPHSQVIWYDSVISTGELKWQNELNNKNRFFTYNHKKKINANSRTYPWQTIF